MNSEIPQDSLQCVNCGIKLDRIGRSRLRLIAEESEELRELLSDWTCKELNNNDALCFECYSLLHLALESGNKTRRLGHKEVCLPCGKSLLQNRNVRILSSSPEYKLAIAQWTPSHQVKHLEVVCLRCYAKARRQVKKTNTKADSNVASEDVEVKIEPLQSLLRHGELDIPASPDSQSEEEGVLDKHSQSLSISLDTYKRAADTSRRCIFKNCPYSDRLIPPRSIKERLLIDYSFFLPSYARFCSYHQINSHKEWSELVNSSSIKDFTAAHIKDIFSILKNTKCNTFCRNLDTRLKQDDLLCQYLLGIKYKQFDDLINDIEPMAKHVRCLKKSLAMYLMKKHTDFSNVKLARFFGVQVKLLLKNINVINRVQAHLGPKVASDDRYVAVSTIGVGNREEIVYYRI